ncbi:MAG: C39 family peptidase [Deltaproteobacteria bacterium]|nr:MAG: C39 family peptidase [Deltaproteobacteria bacterium]
MPKLEGFKAAKQAKQNSCWASAARAITNWYAGKELYATDKDFAKAWKEATGKQVHADIDVQQSAAAALLDLGYDNNTDDHALPTAAEIANQINNERPLLAIVGNAPPNPNPNPNYQNGHWVVIVGISDDQTKLSVFDPDDGKIHDVDYYAATYQAGSYWQNTSYVDPHK